MASTRVTGAPFAPRSAPVCPRCGADNDCAVARRGTFDTPCWCARIVVAHDVVDALPEAQRNVACLCRRCATAAAASSNATIDERATR